MENKDVSDESSHEPDCVSLGNVTYIIGVSFEASFLCGMVRALGLLLEDCSRGLKNEECIMILYFVYTYYTVFGSCFHHWRRQRGFTTRVAIGLGPNLCRR